MYTCSMPRRAVLCAVRAPVLLMLRREVPLALPSLECADCAAAENWARDSEKNRGARVREVDWRPARPSDDERDDASGQQPASNPRSPYALLDAPANRSRNDVRCRLCPGRFRDDPPAIAIAKPWVTGQPNPIPVAQRERARTMPCSFADQQSAVRPRRFNTRACG